MSESCPVVPVVSLSGEQHVDEAYGQVDVLGLHLLVMCGEYSSPTIHILFLSTVIMD
jgi:hypothetical protein